MFTPVCASLRQFITPPVYACLRQFTPPVYACLRLFTRAYASLRQFTPVYASCLRLFTLVYACLRLFTQVYASLRQFSPFDICLQPLTPVYTCLRLFVYVCLNVSMTTGQVIGLHGLFLFRHWFGQLRAQFFRSVFEQSQFASVCLVCWLRLFDLRRFVGLSEHMFTCLQNQLLLFTEISWPRLLFTRISERKT